MEDIGKDIYKDQQAHWQKMKSFNMETVYMKDNQEYTAQLNFSIRGGFPRITVFKDIDNVSRGTIVTSKFNYTRMDRLLTMLLAYKDITEDGILFTFKTKAMEYDDNGASTGKIIDEASIELSRKSGIFYLSVYKEFNENILFKFIDETDVYYNVDIKALAIPESCKLSYITYTSTIGFLRDTFRMLHTTYLKETQMKLLEHKVKAIG